ncbi:tectonic-1 isoform X3 [Egretta garzetta]|uniref:tectonic-1 isoform X3 n=1 Tax=Egretta garzetta TaxID=188379 RepID=UPI00163CE239|nr:tectonic-1 isoform X3 [Egretta garzetta]
MPTSENFDQLLKQFGSASFSAEPDSWNTNTDAQNPSDANDTYRYEYGVPIQTVDAFLRLPSPVVSSWCSDANPAGFLVNQATKCIRSVSVEKCGNTEEVSMLFYISSSILAVPRSSQMVNITVRSIVVQSLNGMRTLLNGSDVLRLPMILDELCVNIVLGNTNKYSQLTILQSTSNQDCLAAQGARTPILFGYNMISGCKLRITAAMKCQPLTQTLLDLLKGQSFPEYVASFGNSQAHDVLDWVPITHVHPSKQSSCQIPVSLEIEVKWTKYGSLVNPQARIVNITATVTTTTLKQLPSGRERTIPITSSVVFTDVSSPAEPGYKAWPTINAKLPFDFFFPFV